MTFEMVNFVLRGVVAIAAGVLMLQIPAPSDGAPAARINAWTTPHVLTISDAGDVDTLNPHVGQMPAVANLSEMTMAWLVKWDEHNQPYPELAMQIPTKANGGVSADGRTVTYHLRKGVTWSDGAPFTSEDVAFSTAVVNNPANTEPARLDMIARVETPDKYTVVFHLTKPYALSAAAFFSSCCANPSLLPKHLLDKYPNINDVPYNALPVGIAPFKFERWDRGKQVVMVANERYWRGRPKLDRIVYKIVPTRDALLAELENHNVDMWYQFGGKYLSQVSALPSYTVARRPSYAYSHIDFNVAHPVVADPVVRQALRLALNRAQLLEKIDHGVGAVQDSALPVSAPYYSTFGTTPYDPAKANAMLDAAGWVRGADGIRAKNGVALNLRAAVQAGRTDVDTEFELVRGDWKQIGVGLTVEHFPAAKWFAPMPQGGIVYGDMWDVTRFVWAADPLGDYSSIYGCKAFPPDGQNNIRWCNATAQGAMDALLGHYDQAQRNDDVKMMMQQFITDVPSIVTYLREDLYGYNRDLKNYRPNSLTPFDNMMDVDI